ncbi:MAG TPA: PAS domain-containing protein [Longimicrobium sp.]|nr:PAS domain-containing protein [Longimicrobium sp.]
MPNSAPVLRILLVEDDEDDYVLARALLDGVQGWRADLAWAADPEAAAAALEAERFDAVLLDYRLGSETGLDLLARLAGRPLPPVILLTGQSEREVDLAASAAGAADYLVKDGLTSALLERAVRYAVARARDREALRAAHDLLSTVVEGIGDPIFFKDAEGRYRMMNGAALRATGLPWEAVAGRTDAELFGPEVGAELAADDRRVRETGAELALEHSHPAEGGVRTFATTRYPHRGAGGAVVGVIGVSRDLTERKRAEAEREALIGALEVERARLETVFREAPAFIAVVRGPDHVCEMANPAFRQLAGGRPLVGLPLRAALPGLAGEGFMEGLDDVFRSGRTLTGREVPLRLAPGVETYVDFAFQPLAEANGRVSGVFVHAVDVTDAVRTRQVVERVAAEWNAILRQVADGVIITDAEGTVTYLNDSARVWEGTFDPRDPLPRQRDVSHLLDERGAPYTPETLPLSRAVLRGETVTGAVVRVRGAWGERVTEVSAAPLVGEDGTVMGAVGAVRDVTARMAMEAELARREAHYRRLVTLSPYTIYALDPGGRFTELNPAGEALLGRPAASLLGRHFEEVVAPEDFPSAAEAVVRVMTGAVPEVEIELRVVRPTGESRLVCVTACGIRAGEAVEGVFGVGRDVTEERERERRTRLLATALESLPEAVSVSDAAHGIVYANTAHARLLGYDPAGGPRRTVDFLPGGADHPALPAVAEALGARGTWRGRLECRRLDDGRAVEVEMMVSTVSIEGQPLLFAVLHDAAEEIARERQLRRAERLASVGTLIGGVAHELNNPLSSIKGFAQLMLLDGRSEEDREALEIMRREAERAAKIVADLRLVARRTQETGPERAPVDLNEVVAHVLKLRRYALTTRNVEVREDLAARLPPILADRAQAEQVLLNLVVNAEQAMAAHDGERRLIVRTRASGDGVAVHVVDSGPGIRPEDLDRVFDPFWTTKPPGEGTGLGLSLVHSIVAEHGGEVRVESEPGKGAAFRVTFPRAAGAEGGAEGPASGAAEAPARPLRVLVVDDEGPVRRTVVRFLERRGHRVDEATEGGDALRRLAAEGEGYDVILSDLRMPGVPGDRFFDALRALGTGLERKLVFLTGDAASGDAARLLATARVPVLYKPFELAELARVVEGMGRESA